MLHQRLKHVRERIQQACQRGERSASSVTLVAVTKTVPVEVIQEAITLGVTDVGENRVQEALAKRAQLTTHSAQFRWHLVGHLQRNKAKDAVELFDVVHSVDSLPLIKTLGEQRATRRPSDALELFIQVNVSGEASKHGCRPEELEPLAGAIQGTKHLTLIGLMTIPPFTDDPEEARPYFRRLRELRDGLNPRLKLSMGMSGDFEVAIEEGADYVRIGTSIFGAHDTGQEGNRGTLYLFL